MMRQFITFDSCGAIFYRSDGFPYVGAFELSKWIHLKHCPGMKLPLIAFDYRFISHLPLKSYHPQIKKKQTKQSRLHD